MRGKWGIAFVCCALAACGFDALGTRDLGPGNKDGGLDAHLPGADGEVGESDAQGTVDGGAGADAADATFMCPTQCNGGCGGGICKIACSGNAPCAKITCPPGMPCTVTCIGNDACTQGVDCKQASSCVVTCDTSADPQDPGACHNVDCGGTTCSVSCRGQKACQPVLGCTGTTQCTFNCMTKSSCCTSPVCNGSGGCTVIGPGDGVGGC